MGAVTQFQLKMGLTRIPRQKLPKRLALNSSVHCPPQKGGFPSLCLASNHKEASSMLGEALTDFLRCPSSKFLEACQ